MGIFQTFQNRPLPAIAVDWFAANWPACRCRSRCSYPTFTTTTRGTRCTRTGPQTTSCVITGKASNSTGSAPSSARGLAPHPPSLEGTGRLSGHCQLRTPGHPRYRAQKGFLIQTPKYSSGLCRCCHPEKKDCLAPAGHPG